MSNQTRLRYYLVDAFTQVPFQGNPAAICVVDRALEAAIMQAIASEMNLSETAFVTEPDSSGSRGLRWFTPTMEVPLCGHATLATGHVLRSLGFPPPYDFSTASGPLAIHAEDDGTLRMDFPADPCSPAEPPPELLEALGLPGAQSTLKGSMNYIVRVDSQDIVDAASPSFSALAAIDLGEGVLVLSLTAPSRTPETDVASRVFAPWAGVDEDPVTGLAHTALGPYWAAELGRDEFRAEQGGRRRGRLRVRSAGERVHLIGHAVTVAEGSLILPDERG